MSPDAPVTAIFITQVSRISPRAANPSLALAVPDEFCGQAAGDHVRSAKIVVPVGEESLDH
jgi:hypothetical protein